MKDKIEEIFRTDNGKKVQSFSRVAEALNNKERQASWPY